MVDLYLTDMMTSFSSHLLTENLNISSELRTLLTEEYANEAKSSDGEVYQKIHEYHFQEQFNLEM
jgi:hypothetical protein